MSEKESQPAKVVSPAVQVGDQVRDLIQRIKPTADAQAAQVDAPDTRALEGEDDLSIAGHEWLKDKVERIY